MLETFTVVCNTRQLRITQRVPSEVSPGQTYQVLAPPMSKLLWHLKDDPTWSTYDRWAFDFIVTEYALHRGIGAGVHPLPIIARQGNMCAVVSPTGVAQVVHLADIEVKPYATVWGINSGEVKFL